MRNNKFTGNFKSHFEQNFYLYVVSLLCIFIGIVLGIYCTKYLGVSEKNDLSNYMKFFIDSFSGKNPNYNYKAIFFQVLKNNMPMFIAIWFLGMTMIGIPIILILNVIKGFTIGFTSSFIISDIGGPKGILIMLIGILPQNIIYISCILLISVIAMEFSLMFIKDRINKQWTSNIHFKMLSYCGLFLVILMIMFTGFIVESYITPNVMRLII